MLEQVVLVDDADRALGLLPKAGFHSPRTPLHRGFSCYLFDPAGRLLVTRRAADKTFGGVWTNSVCGHPGAGERYIDAARRRARQELGVEVRDLRTAVPDFRYRAVDASGVVEHEICPVIVGRVDDAVVDVDDAEVDAVAWLPWAQALTLAAASPQLCSPWALDQLPRLQAWADLSSYVAP